VAVPWLRIIDAVLGITDFTRGRAPRMSAEDSEQLEPRSRTLGHFETRVAGVVVAALKEAFDRDSRRLELEREQLEVERDRAERALKLELLRQAGDREIGRLRLIAGVAVVSWLGSLLLSPRLTGGTLGARVTMGGGWLLLLTALAATCVAQARIGAALGRMSDTSAIGDDLSSGVGGAVAPWLLVVGLALVGLAALL
jgi:hypothetical protein